MINDAGEKAVVNNIGDEARRLIKNVCDCAKTDDLICTSNLL